MNDCEPAVLFESAGSVKYGLKKAGDVSKEARQGLGGVGST